MARVSVRTDQVRSLGRVWDSTASDLRRTQRRVDVRQRSTELNTARDPRVARVASRTNHVEEQLRRASRTYDRLGDVAQRTSRQFDHADRSGLRSWHFGLLRHVSFPGRFTGGAVGGLGAFIAGVRVGRSLLESARSGLGQLLPSVGGAGRGLLVGTRGLLGRVVGLASSATRAVGDRVTGARRWITGGLNTARQGLSNLWNWGKNRLSTLAQAAWNKIWDTTTALLRGVVDGIKRLVRVAVLGTGAAVVGAFLANPLGSLAWIAVGSRLLRNVLDSDATQTIQNSDGDAVIRAPREHEEGFDGGLSALDATLAALGHTADGNRIWNDEFQFVELESGSYMMVLPGVTDLSALLVEGDLSALDWDPNSYTARDTWIAARKSAGSSSIEDNPYAILIREYIESKVLSGEIAQGAEIAIIGHSYGADTALDLASDSDFNGGLVNITHVVGAGYHNEPQLAHVERHTEVAVLQNIYDTAVIGEEVLKGEIEGVGRVAVEGTEELLNTATDGVDFVVEGGVDVAVGASEVVANGASSVLNFFNPFGNPIPKVDLNVDVPDIPDIELAKDSIQRPSSNITLIEFEGGFDGAGHAQSNYEEYLKGRGGAELQDFFDDMTEAGYHGDGRSWGVDITVPEADR